MLEIYKQSIANQYQAALSTLIACVVRCPDDGWWAPVASIPFHQVAFHTTFFADVYLGRDLASLRQQPFHKQHAAEFADYEELEDRVRKVRYDRAFVRDYLQHCQKKVDDVLASETAESLAHCPGFDWFSFSRAEVHAYNIRHIQHHAAQMSLRLRLDWKEDIPWCRSGRSTP